MNPQLFLSIVIPTRNRRYRLEQLLEALMNQSASPDLWEIIIVNNNSNDDTQLFLNTISSSINNLTVFYENRIGSNFARNRGAKAAKGKLIAFIDDDIIPHPQWIERIMHRYERLNIETDCLGGKVLLDFKSQLPRWYGAFLENYLSRIDLGKVFQKTPARTLCSANLVVPKPLIKQVGFFDLKMNRRTGDLRSNDETLTLIKIERLGFCFFYDPSIIVFHQIGHERLKQSYFRRRAWWQGVSDAEMECLLDGKKKLWKEVMWPNFFTLLNKPSLMWLAWRPCRGPRKFSLALQGQLALGRIIGGTWALLRM